MTNKQFDENYLDRELDHLSREMVPLTTPNKVERAVMEAYLKKYRQRSSLFGVGNFGEWFAPGAAIVASGWHQFMDDVWPVDNRACC